jgi:hypothetical protein
LRCDIFVFLSISIFSKIDIAKLKQLFNFAKCGIEYRKIGIIIVFQKRAEEYLQLLKKQGELLGTFALRCDNGPILAVKFLLYFLLPLQHCRVHTSKLLLQCRIPAAQEEDHGGESAQML